MNDDGKTAHLFRTDRKRGLRAETGNGRSTPIASYIELFGDGEEEGGNSVAVIIRYVDTNGKLRHLILPRAAILSAPSIAEALMNGGYNLPINPRNRGLLMEYLRQAKPRRRYKIVARTGWVADHYVLPRGRILRGRSAVRVIYRTTTPPTATSAPRTAGTVEGWQAGVATPALCSDRMMFAISASLSALMLRLMGVDSGVFHFFSERSSAGKTVLELMALSVHGRAARSDLPHWDVTMTGLEELSAEHCDRLLVLDDTAHISADPKKAAIFAQKVAFKITAGRARIRSAVFARAGTICTWRVLILSSGEQGISEIASAAQARRLLGDQLRMIDIPAIGNVKFGVIDKVPVNADSGAIVRRIEKACRTHYGHASREFIRGLADGQAVIKRRAKIFMKEFRRSAGVPPKEPWERRFAERFALAYAAGCLGIQWKILPWRQSRLLRAIVEVYRAARMAVPDADQQMKEVLADLRQRLRTKSDLYDMRKNAAPHLGQIATAPDGLIIEKDGESVYLVKPPVFDRWLRGILPASLVGRKLRQDGHLLVQSRALTTKQVKIRGISGRPRYYCIKESFLQ